MGIKFTDLQGKASKAGPERYKPVNGLNTIRMIGSVIPSYKYWLKTRDNTAVPMDCLGFNRETEVFDNSIRDVVREHFPTMRCSWAYMGYVLDRTDGKIKLFDHKKKLFQSILDAAKDKLGDPTDVDKGWDIIFTRTKTGPLAYNVEYKLEHFKLETSGLTDDEKKLIAEVEPIETITQLPTPEVQEDFIKNFILPEAAVDEEVASELGNLSNQNEVSDDLPA